jgi:ABC-type branched-subunit amino acid transport system substrate-binding protein
MPGGICASHASPRGAGCGALSFLGHSLKRSIEIGVLYSRSGTYRLIGEACLRGTLRAIADLNADPAGAVELVPVERDPGGNVDRYAQLCEELTRAGIKHIIGCVTSWSRKEVIPVLEKSDAMLWYACPYEGYEANEHVVYMHACPNQHLVPLLGYVAPRFGANGVLLGSNYIWGWETNRVARDLIADAGGTVLAERYLPIGETGVERLISEIRAVRPDFILNNLIGTSSYAFIEAYAELGRRDAHFRPDRCPLLSCNLTECELPAIGEAASGHLAAGPYFRDIAGPAERAAQLPGSSFEAAAYASVRVLARVLAGRTACAGSARAKGPQHVRQGRQRQERRARNPDRGGHGAFRACGEALVERGRNACHHDRQRRQDERAQHVDDLRVWRGPGRIPDGIEDEDGQHPGREDAVHDGQRHHRQERVALGHQAPPGLPPGASPSPISTSRYATRITISQSEAKMRMIGCPSVSGVT